MITRTLAWYWALTHEQRAVVRSVAYQIDLVAEQLEFMDGLPEEVVYIDEPDPESESESDEALVTVEYSPPVLMNKSPTLGYTTEDAAAPEAELSIDGQKLDL